MRRSTSSGGIALFMLLVVASLKDGNFWYSVNHFPLDGPVETLFQDYLCCADRYNARWICCSGDFTESFVFDEVQKRHVCNGVTTMENRRDSIEN